MEGWTTARLRDVCEFTRGLTYKKGDKVPASSNVVLRANNVSLETGELDLSELRYISDGIEIPASKKVRPGCLLICTASGSKKHLGKIGYIGEDYGYAFGAFMGLLSPKPNVHPRFLYWLTRSERYSEFVGRLTDGMNINNLSWSHLADFEIPLPPLPEQKRIVAILDEAFEGIGRAVANAEKNLANARELFESVLVATFNRGKAWDRLSLAEMIESGYIISHLDGNHGSNYPRKSEFISSGVLYVSANCIRQEQLDFSLAKFLSPTRANTLRKGIARDRDVLFAHNATVGPVAMLYTDEPKVILSTSLTYYRCNEEKIYPEYLAHYMRSPLFKRQYEAVMRQSTRNQVPITKQREFFHVIPPMETQLKIAEQLDALADHAKRLSAVYRTKLRELATLKQSILQKAFSGELTKQPDRALAMAGA